MTHTSPFSASNVILTQHLHDTYAMHTLHLLHHAGLPVDGEDLSTLLKAHRHRAHTHGSAIVAAQKVQLVVRLCLKRQYMNRFSQSVLQV
jgi:hypothetical protein